MENQIHQYDSFLADSLRLTADKGVIFIESNQEKFDEMLQIALTMPYPYGMRAMRILSLVTDTHPQLFEKHAERLVSVFSQSFADGVKRGLIRIYALNYPFWKLPNLGLLIDHCFRFLADPNEPVAIKYYSAEIITLISQQEPDLLTELKLIVEHEHFVATLPLRKQIKKMMANALKRQTKSKKRFS